MISAFYGYRFYFDPTYVLVLIGAIICMIASAKVRATYNKYSSYRSMSGLTGAQAAEKILRSQGIYGVSIERISGHLTDHYDPRSKTLRLSDSVFGSTSIAAIGVAAHECGHALQDEVGYAPLKIRGALVPVANFGSALSWPLILMGVLLSWNTILIQIGIILFCAVVAFQLITLPVELNASNRAVALLSQNGILHGDEVGQTRKVLNAAALTYVASAAAMILQLLRLLLLFGGRRDDN